MLVRHTRNRANKGRTSKNSDDSFSAAAPARMCRVVADYNTCQVCFHCLHYTGTVAFVVSRAMCDDSQYFGGRGGGATFVSPDRGNKSGTLRRRYGFEEEKYTNQGFFVAKTILARWYLRSE